MKKIIFFILVLLTSIAVQAADLTGVKIYVNPGHGGHDPANDRNVVTIPFAAGNVNGFWESNSNLTKGLVLRDLLEAAGANVVMSRIQNEDADDRNLTQIAEEANANNVDAFLSIHSNAANASANYLLLLYCGSDNAPRIPASLSMTQAAWKRLFPNELTNWTAYTLTNPNLRGDFSFYGYNLGVLNPLTVPGFLSEGSFHDYKPEAHRLLNNDYCKLEAIRFYRYFHDYFEKDLPKTSGEVAGWVKDENERIANPLFTYNSGTTDQWLPLNGATVKLLDAAGANVLKTYTVDDYYNGLFVFYNVAPGNYKLSFEAANHDTKTVDITVTAEQTTFSKTFLRNNNYTEPEVVLSDYPEPNQEAGILALNNYNFTWVTDKLDPAWLNGAEVKRAIYRNDKIYVLTTEPKIYVINANSATLDAVVKELDLTGITGGSVSILSDIAFTADGYLLACNKNLIPYGSTATQYLWKVYTWDDDDAAPSVLFQSYLQGNWTQGVMGETFCVSGPRKHLKCYTISVSAPGMASAGRTSIVGFEYEEGAALLYHYSMDDNLTPNYPDRYDETRWGIHPVFTISPNGDGNNFYIDSDVLLPREYQFDWVSTNGVDSHLIIKGNFAAEPAYNLNVKACGSAFFRHAKHLYMAAPVCESDASKVGVVLFDITNGLNHAVKVSDKYPAEGMGTQVASYMAAAAKVTGYDIELLVWAKNQGIARYKSVETPTANIYASELSVTSDDKFQFILNEDAESVKINILRSGKTVRTYDAGALQKGNHAISNPFPNINFDEWSVSAVAKSVSHPLKVSGNTEQFQFVNLRGIAVDNNPASPYFGRIYASESMGGVATGRTVQEGIYIMDALYGDVTGQGNTATTAYKGGVSWHTSTASPFRLKVAPSGDVFITDWSDAAANVWVMNPADPAVAFRPVFGGTLNGRGVASSNGVDIHGSISDCWITGTEENTKLYTVDEDLGLASGVSGDIYRYDIGTLETPWEIAPSEKIYNDAANGNLQLNGNSCIAPDGRGGWWLSQNRNSGNDTPSVPSLIHIDTKTAGGTVDFNSGKIPDLVGASESGGMAVTADGSRVAVGMSNKIKIYTVSYGAEGAPFLSLLYTIEHTGGATHCLAFDAVNNLYAAFDKSLGVWCLPKANNSYTTHAKYGSTIYEPQANVYASGLKAVKTDDTHYTFTYTLNADAISGTINFISSSTRIDLPIDPDLLVKGENTITVDFSSFAKDDYSWSITVDGDVTAAEPIKVSGNDLKFRFYFPSGLAVDNSFESPYFGRIYVAEGEGSALEANAANYWGGGRITHDGIYAFSPTLDAINTEAYTGNVAWTTSTTSASFSTNGTSPGRISVDAAGKVYIADNSIPNSGIYVLDPANPTADFKPAFAAGTRDAEGLVTSASFHGRISAVYAEGSGENTTLFYIDRNYVPAGMDARAYLPSGMIFKQTIGDLASPISVEPTLIYDNANSRLANDAMAIVPDGRDGFWVAQNRATDASGIPSLMHINSAGLPDYRSKDGDNVDLGNSARGVLALNKSNTLLAVSSNKGAKVFSIAYNAETGIPVLTESCFINVNVTNIDGLAFDVADNLYITTASSEYLLVYALPKADNTFTTPASQKIKIGETGIKTPDVNSSIRIADGKESIRLIAEGTRIKGYTLYNITGVQILKGTALASEVEISTNRLSAGVYVIQIATDNGTVVKRFIKK